MPNFLSLPRIVTSTDADFSANPELGLASLLLELGYEDAEKLTTVLKELLLQRSVFKLLELFMVFASPSISLCAALFGVLLNEDYSESWSRLLLSRAPRHTSGMPNMVAAINSASASNYQLILTWFGYPLFDYEDLIDDPSLFLQWVIDAEGPLEPVVSAIKTGDVSGFIAEVVILHTGQDLREIPTKWARVRRWVNLAYTQYAFGSNAEQTWWF